MVTLTPEQIRALLRDQAIGDRAPWNETEIEVDTWYRTLCADIQKQTGARSRIEWDHYGSGYASYVDAFFYRETPGFAIPDRKRHGELWQGLVVLLSRLAPCYVFMQAEQNWHPDGGSSYLPEFGMTDRLPTPAVAALAAELEPILAAQGLTRLGTADLAPLLPDGAQLDTNLNDGTLRQFDALFHWYD